MLLSRKNFLLNGRKLSLLNYLLTLLRVCQVNRQSIKVLNVLLSFFNGTFEVFSTTTYASEHGIMSLFISISRYKKKFSKLFLAFVISKQRFNKSTSRELKGKIINKVKDFLFPLEWKTWKSP